MFNRLFLAIFTALVSSCATGPVVMSSDAQAFSSSQTTPIDVVKRFGKPPIILQRNDSNALDLIYPQVEIDAWTMRRAFESVCTVFFFGTDQGHNYVRFVDVHESRCQTATDVSNGGRKEITYEQFENSEWTPKRMPANYRPGRKRKM